VLFIGANQHQNLIFDTPRRIRRKRRTLPWFIGANRLNQTDTSYRNQIIRFGGAVIFFNNMRHQTHIMLY
jgi:starvation-inducible outer membrane lipoprotein